MSITDELNQIIIQYELDRYYPRFQKMLKAQKIINDMISMTDVNMEIYLVGRTKTDIEHTKWLIGKCRHTIAIVLDENTEEKSFQELQHADQIWLVSFHGAEKIIEKLEELQVKFENLYDIFLCEGLILEDEYYHILGETYEKDYFTDMDSHFGKVGRKLQLEYYFLNKKFQKETDIRLQNICLEKMLFLTLYMKNFLEAEKCVKQLLQLRGGGREKLNIRKAWCEIEDLLEKIKQKVLSRKQNDIVWFWMDAIGYEDAEDMVFLKRMKENSLSFLNAYTNGPYTHPVLKAIFCQKRYVKDRSDTICVDRTNSELISYLEGRGYQIKIISGYFEKSLAEELRAESTLEGVFDPASMVFWNILESLYSTEDKFFIMAHALIETHAPCLSLKLTSLNKQERYFYGRKELDEQMEFYNSFLNKNVMRIFMSDHGQREDAFLPVCNIYTGTCHIHMDICHPKIQPQKIERMFTLLDSCLLLKQLLEDRLDISTVTRDYVPIECLDLYNGYKIKRMTENKNKLDLKWFGYMGTVSQDEIYFRFSMGKECQHSIKDSSWRPLLILENEIEDDRNLKQLREQAGEYPMETLQEDKFRYSRIFHQMYSIFKERSRELRNALNEYLKSFLKEYSDSSVAIRIGGLHSYCLYSLLDADLKKKIGFFIDKDPQCLCAVYGKVIPTEKIGDENIKMVILSSFDYRDMLKNETQYYPKDVKYADIYDIFEKLGYSFTENFFENMGLKEEDFIIMERGEQA